MINLQVKLPGLNLINPIMPASGCFDFGYQWASHYNLNILGAICVKSITVKPRIGHSNPSFVKLQSGWLNAIGLKNPGLKQVIAQEIKRLRKVYQGPIIANIAGENFAEYQTIAQALSATGEIAALELNISCPNVAKGCLAFGSDPVQVKEITNLVKAAATIPVYVKLSPQSGDIIQLALAAQAGGADGLSLINTMPGMDLNNKTGKPILSNKSGGLSGSALFPVALKIIYDVAQKVQIPIIGMGGIKSASDVIKMISAGASAVAIGTANYQKATICQEIINDLPAALTKLGISDINAIRGRAWK